MKLSLANAAPFFSAAQNSSAATPEELDTLLAPVALYLYALLMEVLAASVDAREVLAQD